MKTLRTRTGARALRSLRQLRSARGPDAARAKAVCLSTLEHASLGRAKDVLELHDLLCFLRAYPDDEAVYDLSERMLRAFPSRTDLDRFRGQLEDTGVAGCDLHAEFYWFTADWLARRFPGQLHVDWDAWEEDARFADLLPALLSEYASLSFETTSRDMRELVAALKGADETDAEFLVRHVRRASRNALVQEWAFDGCQVPLRLAPGDDSPARTLDTLQPAQVAYVTAPPERIDGPVRTHIEAIPSQASHVSSRDARTLIEIGRGAMITRGRDLFAFMHGDPKDVWLVDCGAGLQLVYIGLPPARRHLLYGQWVQLALMNGVPVGYVQACTLFDSVEVNFNIFDTFRDADASRIFSASLASFRRMFGVDAFCINTQQLGEGNPEAIASGAWWFYYKHGFRPVEARLQPLVRRELSAKRRDPTYRSEFHVLERLCSASMHLFLDEHRDDVVGIVDLSEIGVNVARTVHARFGTGQRGARACETEARRLLGLRDTRSWSPGERLTLEHWAPLIVALPGIARWSPARRRQLVPIVRAKGATSEMEYLRLFHEHGLLQKAVLRLALER